MLESRMAIDTPRHDFRNIKEAMDWAKINIAGVYYNKDTEEVIRI